MASISSTLAEYFGSDQTHSARASALAKCDLMTHMVGEFPELQGYMGAHYARAQGEDESVATAIGEHYFPRFAGDDIPATAAGRLVSLADRADSLVGIFAAGLKPSGNKDPFALRRAALGLCRILLEGKIELELDALLKTVATELAPELDVSPETLLELREFIVDRLRHHYREQGFKTELVNAVLESPWKTLPDLDARLQALARFMGREEAGSLAAANKRIANILRKSDHSNENTIDEDRLILAEERRLYEEIGELSTEVDELIMASDYDAALSLLASLKQSVDPFFDQVMVMDEDPVLRSNRLALLSQLKALFDRIADLSILG